MLLRGCMRRATSKNRLCGLTLPVLKKPKGHQNPAFADAVAMAWTRVPARLHPCARVVWPNAQVLGAPTQESTNRSCPGLFSVRLKPDRPTSVDRLVVRPEIL